MIRLLTEDKNRAEILKLFEKEFQSFTVLHGSGYWNGKWEDSLIVEIESNSVEEEKIRRVIRAIKEINDQKVVLVQIYNTYPSFI